MSCITLTFQRPKVMVVVAIRLLVLVDLIHTGKRGLAVPGDLLDKTWVS